MEIVFEVFGLNPCIPRFFLLPEQFLQDTSNEAKYFLLLISEIKMEVCWISSGGLAISFFCVTYK